jgi:DNA-binding NarL/FixJ family response regulator
MAGSEGAAPQINNDSRQEPLTVAIIEDLTDIRAGLQALINGSRGFRCVGAYSSMEESLRDPTSASPTVLLVDIGLPGM